MNIIRRAGCRIYQKALYLATFFLNFSEPELHEGEASIKDIPLILEKHHNLHPLVLTDPGLVKFGLEKPLLGVLTDANIGYSFFKDVCPNPTFDVIEQAYEVYQKGNCDCLIALGGGSSIDTAKAVGAKVSNPHRSLQSFKGLLKVHRKLPLLIAIPTTAGTGSEATVAAVIVNPKTKDKFSINDPKLIPAVAVLDPEFLKGLPGSVIASTGVDALTHAIESYIGHSSTKKSKDYALKALSLIHDNLYAFYLDKEAVAPRVNMQKAAYLAGVSFTRAYVGYVHALAHALGGFYNVPHGYANAVLLPHVLRHYGTHVYKRLAEVSDYLSLVPIRSSNSEKAEAVITWIEGLNAKMGIPKTFGGIIKPSDLEALARHADKEANPLYPVPLELNKNELLAIYQEADQK